MVNAPFTDSTPDGSMVVARDTFIFLQVALQSNSGAALVPDNDAFEQTNVRAIYNPDGADVTSLWATNAIDPVGIDGAADTYDAAHPTYVGGEATPNNIGLFHDGSGRIAQKAKAPTNAEVTLGSTSRRWRVDWAVRRGGVVIPKTEYFHVAEAGVLVTNTAAVNVQEVTDGIYTTLGTSQIERLIAEATRSVRGRVEKGGIVWAELSSLPDLIREAIIYWSRWLVLNRDAGAGLIASEIKEGSKRVKFAGRAGIVDNMKVLADAALNEYLSDAPRYQPGLKVVTRRYNHDSVFR